MIDRRLIRGDRKPVVVDLLVLREGLHGLDLLAAACALIGMPVVALLYGLASAAEMRTGWGGSSILTGLLHSALVLGSVAGVSVLTILSPPAAGMALASVCLLLLWSSSWA
jgi:hypothetical protein